MIETSYYIHMTVYSKRHLEGSIYWFGFILIRYKHDFINYCVMSLSILYEEINRSSQPEYWISTWQNMDWITGRLLIREERANNLCVCVCVCVCLSVRMYVCNCVCVYIKLKIRVCFIGPWYKQILLTINE